MLEIELAHGVGRVYESSLPLWVYLAAGAAAVFGSFLVRARAGTRPEPEPARLGPASGLVATGRVVSLLSLGLLVIFAVAEPGRGFSGAQLFFWVGLVVGTTLACSVFGGLWERIDPWAFLHSLVKAPGGREGDLSPPWWLGPLLIYGLFWFELVSGQGFDSVAVLVVVLGYTIYALGFRARFGDAWRSADPLSILFDLASASAPLEIREEGLFRLRAGARLHRPEPMTPASMASLFVIFASTTLDNARETVQWSQFMAATGLRELSITVVDSAALALLAIPFLLSFAAALAPARKSFQSPGWRDLMGRFAWSLVPIAVAYVLAHNMPLLMTGLPRMLSEVIALAGPRVFSSMVPSPQLVWAVEIVLIVGGHILGVLAAHRIALEMAPDPGTAARAHLPLALLMSLYTVGTLWLLSLPLVR